MAEDDEPSSMAAQGELASEGGLVARRRIAIAATKAPALGAVKSAWIRRELAKACKADDFPRFNRALVKPGAAALSADVKWGADWEHLVFSGACHLPAVLARRGKSPWLQAMMDAGSFEEGPPSLLAKLAKECVDVGAFDLAIDFYERGGSLHQSVLEGLQGGSNRWVESAAWKGRIDPDGECRKDALSYAVAMASPELVAGVGAICLARFHEGDVRALPSLVSAMAYAEAAWASTAQRQFKECAAVLAPLAREALQASGLQAEAEMAAAKSGSPTEAPPDRPSPAASDAFMKMILDEVRALRGEVGELRASVDAFQGKAADGSIAGRLSRWRSGGVDDASHPKKTPGASNWRG